MNKNLAAALQVGEIFREAGNAFNRLSEMTVMLHPMEDSSQGGKWTNEEIDMLRSCVHRFAVDLSTISKHIKNRSDSQIRTNLKQKAFEKAGLPFHPVSSTVAHGMYAPKPPKIIGTPSLMSPQPVIGQNAEVTLNMLNAMESEIDVEALINDVKLEFETSTDEVPT